MANENVSYAQHPAKAAPVAHPVWDLNVNHTANSKQPKADEPLFSSRLPLGILTPAILIAGVHYWAPNAILVRFAAVVVLVAGIGIQIWTLDRATVSFGSQEPESGWRYSGGNVWTAQRRLKPSVCFLLEVILLLAAVADLELTLVEVILGYFR